MFSDGLKHWGNLTKSAGVQVHRSFGYKKKRKGQGWSTVFETSRKSYAKGSRAFSPLPRRSIMSRAGPRHGLSCLSAASSVDLEHIKT